MSVVIIIQNDDCCHVVCFEQLLGNFASGCHQPANGIGYVIGRPTVINPALVHRINDMLYGG